MTLNWQDNTAKVGGVDFKVHYSAGFWRLNIHIPSCALPIAFAYSTEAEARAAAEEIASAIFKGEEVWRIQNNDGLLAYVLAGTVFPDGSTWRIKQRGVWVPLEGE